MPGQLTCRAVLFDLYSTLIDIWTDEHRDEVWADLSRLLSYYLIDVNPSDLAERFFSAGARQQRESSENYPEINVITSFGYVLDDLGAPQPAELAASIARVFRTLSTLRLQLYPDVLPALSRIRGRLPIGIVSDAQVAYFNAELRATGLAEVVDVTIASGDYGYHKPDPRLFRLALGQLRVPAQDAIYVGNSVERDLVGAQAAGITAVLLDRTGWSVGHRPASADRVVRNLHELADWVLASQAGLAGDDIGERAMGSRDVR